MLFIIILGYKEYNKYVMIGLKEKESSDEPSAKRKREEPPHESGNFMYLF